MGLTDKPPCPFCGSPFGHTSEFMWGCANSECPEHPRIHDPVGMPDIVDAFWNDAQQNASYVRLKKRLELINLESLVNKYYQD